jgi:hypothetical protein
MLRLGMLIAMLLTMGLLFGCVKTQYHYIPPAATADKGCISRCIQGKNYCQNLCQLKYESCIHRSAIPSMCKRTCNCVISFNTCYTACGGKVT